MARDTLEGCSTVEELRETFKGLPEHVREAMKGEATEMSKKLEGEAA